MYEVKIEEIRVEIKENMKDKITEKDSMWMIFAKFIAECFLGFCRLLGLFFRGLWSFIKYGYYRLMIWAENNKE